jgi:thioredoxin reductase (NADPH)
VVGGGDAAMEDALVLARTSRSVTVVHRRGRFRASKVLGDRVVNHPLIRVLWNTTVKEILGKAVDNDSSPEGDTVDLDGEDELPKVVKGVVLKDTGTGVERRLDCDAVFVAIGHTPNTAFLQGVVEFNPDHPGYVQTFGGTTQTSVKGIFAAGDVADSVYRQAITSAGSGAASALDAERYLSEHGLGNEAAELEAELMAELMEGTAAEIGSHYNAYEEAGGRVHGMKESMAAEL